MTPLTHRLTRLALSAIIAAGTIGGALAATMPQATPALADDGHGWHDRDWHDRDDHFRDRDDRWHDRDGRWHDRDGWRPAPVFYGGPRWYDRDHGYWRDRAGYWNPHSGLYIRLGF
jgi:hypothetical protein